MRSLISLTMAALLAVFTPASADDEDDRLDKSLEGRGGPVVSSKFAGRAAYTDYDRRQDDRYDERYRDYGYKQTSYRDDRYRDRRGYSELRCHSRGGRYKVCDVGRDVLDIAFLRRLDDCRCRKGRDWGYTRDGVWVDNGCNAVFKIVVGDTYRRYDDDRRYRDDRYKDRRYDSRDRYGQERRYGRYDSYEKRDTIACSSFDRRYAVCRLPHGAREVRITKRWSDAGCRKGKDWGVRRDGIWVDNGCRASFSFVLRSQYAYEDRRRRY